MIRIFLLLILDHIRHRPFRTLFTVIGVAIGVSAWLAIRLANGEVHRSFEHSVEKVVGKASVTLSGGRDGMDESLIDIVQGHPGVQSAHPMLKIEVKRQENYFPDQTFIIWGVDILDYVTDLHSGDSPDSTSDAQWEQIFSPRTVYVGKDFAEEFRI